MQIYGITFLCLHAVAVVSAAKSKPLKPCLRYSSMHTTNLEKLNSNTEFL